MKKNTLHLLYLLLLSTPSMASDIVEILPITNKIIVLHFDDGFATYHKMGQSRSNESVTIEPLNIIDAIKVSKYILTSIDDTRFVDGQNPIETGRKSKGVEFTWLCQGWGPSGCINTSPDHVEEHWIYLFFDEAFESGKTYTLKTSDIANNGTEWKFVFDENTVRSEALHVNLIGYSTLAPEKFGYAYHWMGDKGSLSLTDYSSNRFYLLDLNSDEPVFEGILKYRKGQANAETTQAGETPNKNFLGAEVYECDFSAFNTPGKYKLVVEGMGSSYPFTIEEDIYRQVFYTTSRGLYHNRSGIELKEPFTEFTRAAPHNPLVTPGFSGKLKYTSSRFIDWTDGDNDNSNPDRPDKKAIEAGIKGPLDTWGWYQDAGDWDSYFTHMNIPMMLMLTWEIKPENFSDMELNIPESGNGIPDILDEASWLIRFFYRTRHEIMDKGYGTGGIGSRVCSDHFGGDGEGDPSYKDVNRTWIVSGEDPHTTFKYAGLAAQFAYCLKKAEFQDPENIDWEKEAREAYDWALLNTLEGDLNLKPAMPFLLKDIRAGAAASLYRLTKEQTYHDQLKSDLSGLSANALLADEKRWAPMIYSLTEKDASTDELLLAKTDGSIIKTANTQVNSANARACRWGGNFSFPMLVGQGTTPMVFETIIAYQIVKTKDSDLANNYLTLLYNTADYFLGNNPLNQSWITGLGIHRPERVFHMDSWYNGKNEPAPGITPYGPWRDENWMTGQGAWDVRWPYKAIYPADINQWPGHERWFGNSTCPLNAEYTVHQNTILNATVYGFLCSVFEGEFADNKKPQVQKPVVTNQGNNSDSVLIQAVVSDPDGDSTIYKVEFYDSWHKIGEKFSPPYEIVWLKKTGESINISTKVFDMLGSWNQSVSSSEILTASSSITIDAGSQLRVYPNPTSESVRFEMADNRRCIKRLLIYNSEGKLLDNIMANLESGNRFIEWNPKREQIQAGIYLYKAEIETLGDVSFNNGKIIIQ